MLRRYGVRVLPALAALVVAGAVFAVQPAFAEEQAPWSLGEPVNTGTDTGFYAEDALRSGDPHYGWELGTFLASGFESVAEEDGVTVFTVLPGDSVDLSFRLDQDVDALNGDPGLSIARDTNGRDERLGVPEQDFGRGALIVSRSTAGEGAWSDPEVVVDFLGQRAEQGASVQVGTFGPGDYRVSLDYELREDALVLLGASVLPSFTNYKVAFSFAVREARDATPPNVDASPSSSAEGQPDDAPGMPVWQIVVMVGAIGVGSLLVIRGERGGRRR